LEPAARCQGLAEEPRRPEKVGTVFRLKWAPANPGASFYRIDLQASVESANGMKAWAELEALLARFWSKAAMAEDQWKRTGEKFLLWPAADLVIGGHAFAVQDVNSYVRPVLLT